MNCHQQLDLEAPPPDLRNSTLWARIVDWERADGPLPQSRPRNGARVASPQSPTLRPGGSSLAELDAARQQRTIHLLVRPDILTCSRQRCGSGSTPTTTVGIRWSARRRSSRRPPERWLSADNVPPSSIPPVRDSPAMLPPSGYLQASPRRRVPGGYSEGDAILYLRVHFFIASSQDIGYSALARRDSCPLQFLRAIRRNCARITLLSRRLYRRTP